MWEKAQESPVDMYGWLVECVGRDELMADGRDDDA